MTEAAYIGKDVNYAAFGICETGKSGAWKIWHISPHYRTKGFQNKGGSYTGAYAPKTDCNKAAEI